MKAPPDIDQAVFKSTAAGGFDVSFDRLAEAGFRTLLSWLPDTWELSFYDQFYPSVSDPGAYVTVQRRGPLFVYRLGNHGWSSRWKVQSLELIAAWMRMNLKAKHRHSIPLRTVRIGPAVRSAWDETGRLQAE